ncbi:MAG: TIGR03960 family B12-binding radical SAM protein [Desulfobacterales bacterium]|jgi:radical SAM family uncharacterized protein/radical SAM-linked protein
MTIDSIDDILPFVEKPSRYLGSEINTIRKDLDRAKLRFALAFPDLYEIGTSHFGMQILYHILNANPDIAAERVFAPASDMEALLRSSGQALFSLESRKAIRHFDIIGFSLLYELNYTNILTILELGQIPFLAAERTIDQPLIIAGGPCTCNPEPIAEFFDAIVVGDGENVVVEMSGVWLRWKEEIRADKESLLKRWSQIEGVYIPSFFEAHIDDRGIQTVSPRYSDYTNVRRAVVSDLDKLPFPEKPIVPFGKPVHDRLRLEVARGCTRGCRFCQAGMIYRPVRERSPQHLLSMSVRSIAATGYEDISLLSLSTGDYGCIIPLMEGLMTRFASDNVAVSLPSLRAGTLTPELMGLIKKVRKTGFTIAPEAGSQRLRDVINKNITEKEIIDTIKDAFNMGWQVIKLYFMIGLPTETTDDLKALVDLVKKLRKIKGPGARRGKINVSVATFIPKSHTPFQWAGQISLAESRSKINWLHDRLRLPGIQFKWQNPEVSWLEGLWARGNRKLSRLLVRAYKKGCRFDGWSDKFSYRLWQEALEEMGLEPDLFSTGKQNLDEPLPWDHIDSRVSRAFLKTEWEKALEGSMTDDCRQGSCAQCGTCDFKEIEMLTYPDDQHQSLAVCSKTEYVKAGSKKLSVGYAKLDQAKYLGHLEMVNVFLRALKRAEIPVVFSEGFHPKPKISFDDPLPVGIESQEEQFTLSVPGFVRPETVIRRLNAHLPDGLAINSCQLAALKPGNSVSKKHTYLVTLKEGHFDEEKLASFNRSSEATISLTNRKGKLKKINLKDMVLNISFLDSTCLQMTLLSVPGKTARPALILRYIFGLAEDQIKQARVIKQRV